MTGGHPTTLSNSETSPGYLTTRKWSFNIVGLTLAVTCAGHCTNRAAPPHCSRRQVQCVVRCDSLLYNELYNTRCHMDTLTYSEARSKLANTMDKVCDDHAPIIITRKNSQSVVMMSLDDYQALEETAYLLRSPKNARRLLESIAELKTTGGTRRKLLD